jgi:hypothetical protein
MEPLLERLAAQLARGDAATRDLVVEQATPLVAVFGAEGRRLVDLVLRFDLEAARGVAEALLQRMRSGEPCLPADITPRPSSPA